MLESDIRKTAIAIWNERDRLHIELTYKDGDTIIEWWDEDAVNAIELGILPRASIIGFDLNKMHRAALEQAIAVGLYSPEEDRYSSKTFENGKVYRKGFFWKRVRDQP